MNEKSRNIRTTNGDSGARGCERSEQLVAYLYGESSPEETATFRVHLNACPVCRSELSAFTSVRELVGNWHTDVLNAAPSLDVDELLAPQVGFQRSHVRNRSALAAVRAFFSLSPFWLRAGAVAATLIVCALAAFTVARTEVRWNPDGLVVVQTGVPERVVIKEVAVAESNGYTKEQMTEIVNREIEIARKQWESERQQNATELTVGGTPESPNSPAPGVSQRPNSVKNRKRNIPPQRERQVLAKNFRDDDDDLPRLSDLLGGVY